MSSEIAFVELFAELFGEFSNYAILGSGIPIVLFVPHKLQVRSNLPLRIVSNLPCSHVSKKCCQVLPELLEVLHKFREAVCTFCENHYDFFKHQTDRYCGKQQNDDHVDRLDRILGSDVTVGDSRDQRHRKIQAVDVPLRTGQQENRLEALRVGQPVRYLNYRQYVQDSRRHSRSSC